jgi:anti-sigma factor RsiW
VVAFVMGTAVLGWRAGEDVVAQAVATHTRATLDHRLIEVASSDRHTVKPWLSERLDYSPPVRDLVDEGFPLLGGRLDYLHRRPVAVVVYGRRQHMINAYSWPADAGDEAVSPVESRHGYNLVHWRRGGVEHWVVSDLNAGELMQFVGAVNGER